MKYMSREKFQLPLKNNTDAVLIRVTVSRVIKMTCQPPM